MIFQTPFLSPYLPLVVSRPFRVLRSYWLLDSTTLLKYLTTATYPVQIRRIVAELSPTKVCSCFQEVFLVFHLLFVISRLLDVRLAWFLAESRAHWLDLTTKTTIAANALLVVKLLSSKVCWREHQYFPGSLLFHCLCFLFLLVANHPLALGKQLRHLRKLHPHYRDRATTPIQIRWIVSELPPSKDIASFQVSYCILHHLPSLLLQYLACFAIFGAVFLVVSSFDCVLQAVQVTVPRSYENW